MQIPSSTVLALDVGGARIGVAEANLIARIAHPLTTLHHTETIIDDIVALIAKTQSTALIVGLPRGMSGQETQQTSDVEAFIKTLHPRVTIPIFWQDEALTSKKAEAELTARRKPFKREDIDALAATYILDDFLRERIQEIL